MSQSDPAGDRIATVGVVGAGIMGMGIAEVLARSGLQVVVGDLGEEVVARGLGRLDASLAKAAARGMLAADEQAVVRQRVRGAGDLGGLRGCDLVIEAASEDLAVKLDLFAELDRLLPPDTLLASNTSSLPLARLGAATGRPDRVVGLHFFNPAPVMRLVEVVRDLRTAPEVAAAAVGFAERLGKTPLLVGDRAGFVVNRLLCPYLNHAAVLLDQGAATRDEIDDEIRAQLGHPMGPFQLMDLIGLDTLVAVMEAIWAETRAPRHAPAAVLRELTATGLLGRKAGGGFYGDPGVAGREGWLGGAGAVAALVGDYLADAAAMAGSGYASGTDLDVAMKLGCGHPEGPGELLARLGDKAVAQDRHHPAQLRLGLARLR